LLIQTNLLHGLLHIQQITKIVNNIFNVFGLIPLLPISIGLIVIRGNNLNESKSTLCRISWADYLR
jgi:hypothetical protein